MPHSKETIAKVLEMFAGQEKTITQIYKETGITPQTISAWISKHFLYKKGDNVIFKQSKLNKE